MTDAATPVAAERRGWESLAVAGARRAGAALARSRLFESLRLRAEEADWRQGRRQNGFFGRYETFDEAIAAAPSQALGYDDAAMIDVDATLATADAPAAMRPSEYPVLFWLREAIAAGARGVLDVGGHLGLAYRQARRYIALPDDLRWFVYDVPAVAAAGRAEAARRGEDALRFIDDLADWDGFDVALVAGSLQYLPPDFLAAALRRMARPPVTLLFQRAAMSPTQSFVTLQTIVAPDGGVRFCPYVVARRSDLVADLAALGYRETDAWTTERRFSLPGHPECDDVVYAGARFTLDAAR